MLFVDEKVRCKARRNKKVKGSFKFTLYVLYVKSGYFISISNSCFGKPVDSKSIPLFRSIFPVTLKGIITSAKYGRSLRVRASVHR